MALFSLIDNSTDAILERARDFTDRDPSDPRTLTQKFGPAFASRWVVYISDASPQQGVDYDPAIERVVMGDAVTSDEHHRTATVTARSAEELAAIADAADRNVKRLNVSGAISTLRVWAQQAENTTVTQGNAVATLQQVVDRLGVFFDRFADLVEGQGFDEEI